MLLTSKAWLHSKRFWGLLILSPSCSAYPEPHFTLMAIQANPHTETLLYSYNMSA